MVPGVEAGEGEVLGDGIVSDLTLTQAWERLRALGDRKPAYSIAEANKRGYFNFIGKDESNAEHWYELSSKGHGKFSVRRI